MSTARQLEAITILICATTIGITTLSIMGLFATLSITVLSANLLSVAILHCYAECRYAEGPHAGCRGAFNLDRTFYRIYSFSFLFLF